MTMRTAIEIARCQGGYFVSISGPGRMQQSPSFQEFVAGCLDGGQVVTVDLTECGYLDSTFLGCLIGLHKRSMRMEGASLRFIADGPARLRLFSTSTLDQVLDFADQRPELTSPSISLDCRTADVRSMGRHIMQAHQLLAELGGDEAEACRAVADRLQQELERSPDNAN